VELGKLLPAGLHRTATGNAMALADALEALLNCLIVKSKISI